MDSNFEQVNTEEQSENTTPEILENIENDDNIQNNETNENTEPNETNENSEIIETNENNENHVVLEAPVENLDGESPVNESIQDENAEKVSIKYFWNEFQLF